MRAWRAAAEARHDPSGAPANGSHRHIKNPILFFSRPVYGAPLLSGIVGYCRGSFILVGMARLQNPRHPHKQSRSPFRTVTCDRAAKPLLPALPSPTAVLEQRMQEGRRLSDHRSSPSRKLAPAGLLTSCTGCACVLAPQSPAPKAHASFFLNNPTTFRA